LGHSGHGRARPALGHFQKISRWNMLYGNNLIYNLRKLRYTVNQEVIYPL